MITDGGYDEFYVPPDTGAHIDGVGGIPTKDSIARPFGLTILRSLAAAPVLLLGLLLCLTIIGIPIGLPIIYAAGMWANKPLRKHPLLNIKGDA